MMNINTSDMKFYFKELPDMTPSTGGYIFDDLTLPDNSEDIFESIYQQEMAE